MIVLTGYLVVHMVKIRLDTQLAYAAVGPLAARDN